MILNGRYLEMKAKKSKLSNGSKKSLAMKLRIG